jgi:hypothetical protein
VSTGPDLAQGPPDHPPIQPAPAAPVRRRNWLLIGCLGVLGISLVCGLATIAGLNLFVRGARSSLKSYQTAVRATMDVDGTALASGTGVAVKATIPAAGAGTVGNRVTAGNLAVIVHEVRDNVPLPPAEQAKPGMRAYAVDLSLTNTGAEPLDWYASFGAVRTAENREFPARSAVTRGLQPALFGAGTLEQNQTTRGWLVFEVPSDARVTQFRYDGPGGADVAVNLP